MEKNRAYGAIDIGGSKIKAGLVIDNDLSQDFQEKTPKDKEELLDRLQSIIKKLEASADLSAIAVGVPGLVSYKIKRIIYSPNVGALSGLNFSELLKTEIPVFIGNDADMAMYGENLRDESAVMITIGTGLGGAISLEGTPPEMIKMSGEIGHMKINLTGKKCSCGRNGCLESYVSSRAIVLDAIEKISPKICNAKEVFDLARGGNKEAKNIIEEMADALGVGISNLVNILGVEKIILSGQISKSADLFLEKTRETVVENILAGDKRRFEISVSQHIDDGSLIGAARFAEKQLWSSSNG